MTNKIFVYIDETGDYSDCKAEGSLFFMLGCAVADNNEVLNERCLRLKEDIKNDKYFYKYMNDFNKYGFHASTNHLDIKSKFISLLNTLNYRSYIAYIDKNNFDYKNKYKTIDDAYHSMLKALLGSIFLKYKNNKIEIIIEQSSTKINRESKKINETIIELISGLKHKRLLTGDIEYDIALKNKNSYAGLEIIDYVNSIMYNYLAGSGKVRVDENLEIVESKCAIVYDVMRNRRYSWRKCKISLGNFLQCN